MIDQDVWTTNEVLESEIELVGHLKTMSEKVVIAKKKPKKQKPFAFVSVHAFSSFLMTFQGSVFFF